VLDAETRRVERVLLEIRLADGLDTATLDDAGRGAASEILADGLIDADHLAARRLVLTRRGRLLADAVVHRLLR
jgi:oxygen-independent coproporphyrinogen-3 oxidase